MIPAAGLIMVFGESLNDSQSVRFLLAAQNPGIAVERIQAQPRPSTLQRTAGAPAVRRWITDISKVVRGIEATGRRVAAVVVHRDADSHDPEGVVHRLLTEQLASMGNAHGVVPVEELEAWWFLFPGAVEMVRPRAWRGCLPRRARDVETIRNPKQELARLTRSPHSAAYTEADSTSIARAVYENGLTPVGTSFSFRRFEHTARSIR